MRAISLLRQATQEHPPACAYSTPRHGVCAGGCRSGRTGRTPTKILCTQLNSTIMRKKTLLNELEFKIQAGRSTWCDTARWVVGVLSTSARARRSGTGMIGVTRKELHKPRRVGVARDRALWVSHATDRGKTVALKDEPINCKGTTHYPLVCSQRVPSNSNQFDSS